MCAKMRRGALNEALLSQGIHKIALGHHHDDAVETFLMSLLYEGRISCFQPVTLLDRTGITQIRPMLYLPEQTVVHVASSWTCRWCIIPARWTSTRSARRSRTSSGTCRRRTRTSKQSSSAQCSACRCLPGRQMSITGKSSRGKSSSLAAFDLAAAKNDASRTEGLRFCWRRSCFAFWWFIGLSLGRRVSGNGCAICSGSGPAVRRTPDRGRPGA